MKWLSREIDDELRRERDFWRDRANQLEMRLDELRARHDERMDEARKREIEIFDKALKRHGSTPVVRPAPGPVPSPVPSSEEVAYAEDWIAEYIEVFPGTSIREASNRFKDFQDGLYDPKSDPRVPSALRP